MADGMNFDKYIDNPSGQATVVTNRNMYKQMYKAKFDRVLVKENGKIDWQVYISSDSQDSYYIYMKIPSEVIEKFYYDVVVRLYTTENTKKSNVNLREYAVQFYSNDPAFYYTFVHAFRKGNLFIKDLEAKMPAENLKSVAKVKNPKDNIWYVKSLYFAYLTMEKYNLFNRNILKTHGKKYDKKALLKQVMNASEKVAKRQAAQDKLDKGKAKEKKKTTTERKDKDLQSKHTPISTITKTPKISKAATKSKITTTTKKATMRRPKV